MRSFEITHHSQAHEEPQLALRRRVNGLVRRIAAGADLLVATQRFDLARMMVSWGDLRRR
jgi:hypothetical protein